MGQEEIMHLNHYAFNQKGDHFLQDQFWTRIMNQNLNKGPHSLNDGLPLKMNRQTLQGMIQKF